MAITLKELSKQLGLSPASISLVLNNRPNRISEEKRELILRTAAELNYAPNMNAVGLVKGRSKTLGVVVPDISNTFFAEIISGISHCAQEHGWNTIISDTADSYTGDLRGIATLAARDVDAILLAVASDARDQMADMYTQTFESFGKPIVLVDRLMLGLRASMVAIDHEKGAFLAMKYLYQLGHRRIACLTGPRYNSTNRMQGVLKAVRSFSLPHTDADDFVGKFTIESGYAAGKEIMSGDYTAVFSFNDLMAYGLHKYFREHHVRIPEDISLIGFDDVFFSDYMGLTTIRQPAYDIGYAAAKRALFEIENRTLPTQTILFEPELKERNSTQAYHISNK